MKLREIVGLFRDSFSEWSLDNVSTLSAALAYYTIFSLAPLLVFIIGITGIVFGETAGREKVLQELGGMLGPHGVATLRGILEQTQNGSAGIVATTLSVILLVVGVAGVFYQLQTSLNTVWDVAQQTSKGIWSIVKTRLASFSIVPVIGFLLIVSLVVSAAISAFGHFLGDLFPALTMLLHAIDFLLSLVVIGVLFALIYKMLPDVRVKWRDVWLGAGVTSLLFALGKFGIGLYLGKSGLASSYGAASSLVVLLAWVYYSSQIFFFGAEFTQLYANRYGSHIKPTAQAAPVAGEKPRDQKRPSQPGKATVLPTKKRTRRG